MKTAIEQVALTIIVFAICAGCYYALGCNHYRANARDIGACRALSIEIGHNPESCR